MSDEDFCDFEPEIPEIIGNEITGNLGFEI